MNLYAKILSERPSYPLAGACPIDAAAKAAGEGCPDCGPGAEYIGADDPVPGTAGLTSAALVAAFEQSESQGTCPTVAGCCDVEPDGRCHHGSLSVLRAGGCI